MDRNHEPRMFHGMAGFRRCLDRIALGTLLSVSGGALHHVHAGETPGALELRQLGAAREIGRDLAGVRDQLDGLVFELAPLFTELQRLEDQAQRGGGRGGDAALVLEQRRLELRRRLRKAATAQLEPMLPRIQTLQQNNRTRVQEALRARGGFQRLTRAWLKGDRTNATVLTIAMSLATERLGQQAFALYQASLVGDIQDTLATLKKTLGLIDSVTKSDSTSDEYNHALDDLLAGQVGSGDDPADQLDGILDENRAPGRK